MARAKKGDRYVCDECGMVISVDEPCGCDACEIVCCDVPMVKAAGVAKKAIKKTAPVKSRAGPQKGESRRQAEGRPEVKERAIPTSGVSGFRSI